MGERLEDEELTGALLLAVQQPLRRLFSVVTWDTTLEKVSNTKSDCSQSSVYQPMNEMLHRSMNWETQKSRRPRMYPCFMRYVMHPFFSKMCSIGYSFQKTHLRSSKERVLPNKLQLLLSLCLFYIKYVVCLWRWWRQPRSCWMQERSCPVTCWVNCSSSSSWESRPTTSRREPQRWG